MCKLKKQLNINESRNEYALSLKTQEETACMY